MAFDPQFKMSIQDINGNYYTAGLSLDGTYTVTTTPTQTFLPTIPKGWDDMKIVYQRDSQTLGIFRSSNDESSGSYQFAKEARAIIQFIRRTQGVKGYGLLTTWILDYANINPALVSYLVFYASNLDFTTYKDSHQEQLLSIDTLDSGLSRDYMAYKSTVYNMPIWQPDGLGGWVTDASFVVHDGIKLLYSSTYNSSASPDNPLIYNNGGAAAIGGFNRGRHGTSPTTAGFHTIVNLAPYNIVANNGTTTNIGNDILQPFLIQGTQQNSANGGYPGEEFFAGANNSRSYTSGNNSLKNLLPNSGITSGTINVNLNVSATILPGTAIFNTDSPTAPFLGFVLFEIAPNDICTPDPITGEFSYIPIYRQPLLPLLGISTPTIINQTSAATLNYDRAYLFALVYDDLTNPRNQNDYIQTLKFSNLQFSISSLFDWGASGEPIPAPSFPPSVFPAFRLHQVLEKLVPYLATTNTDGYGFPLPVTTPYTGVSTFLNNPAQPPIADLVPYQVMLSSSYCIHDLQGQSYLSISLDQLADFCKKQCGTGLGRSGNTIRIENLEFFFDSSTMILDLGYDVFGFEETELIDGLGANLKLGYTAQDLNSDFGTDIINTALFFNTPLSEIPGTMDFTETGIITEIYAIEKDRARIVNQPVGATYDPASPSTDNQTYAFYTLPNQTQILPAAGGNPNYPNLIEYDPSNNPVNVFAYQLTQRNGVNLPAAQSLDPTAAAAPYIFGTRYPDSVYNIELSPCRALQRATGKYLHSIFDTVLDSFYLTFRDVYQMQFNNTVSGLSGIESNLVTGGANPVTTEFKDIKIGTLPAPLFRPVIYTVTSKYPVNLYNILDTNPNGYIRFWSKNENGFGYTERKMFLMKAEQAANGSATVFTGYATPDMPL